MLNDKRFLSKKEKIKFFRKNRARIKELIRKAEKRIKNEGFVSALRCRSIYDAAIRD